MQPMISVIVPVYKVEDCLVRCLDSLCQQSLPNIEILLIDDASPDKCGKICDVYATKDRRFKVFHNEKNLGLSVARNIGIANATSDFLMFVDSDDWVHKDFCKIPYECAVQNQADLVMFRFQRISKHKKSERFLNQITSQDYLHSGSKTQLEAIDFLNACGNYAWNKLYHKDLFRHISYPPGYLYEDVGTTYKIVLNASHIYYLDKELYYYCYRSDSITTLNVEKSLKDLVEMTTQQYFDLVACGYSPDKLRLLLERTALDYCIKKKPNTSDKHYMFCKKVLLDSQSIPVNLSRERKVLFLLFKYCRPLFELLCMLFNKKI